MSHVGKLLNGRARYIYIYVPIAASKQTRGLGFELVESQGCRFNNPPGLLWIMCVYTPVRVKQKKTGKQLREPWVVWPFHALRIHYEIHCERLEIIDRLIARIFPISQYVYIYIYSTRLHLRRYFYLIFFFRSWYIQNFWKNLSLRLRVKIIIQKRWLLVRSSLKVTKLRKRHEGGNDIQPRNRTRDYPAFLWQR